MTLAKKLFLIVLCNVFAAALLAGVGFWAEARLTQTQADMQLYGTALRQHLEGDMMHDAIRGDVLLALYAASSPNSAIGKADDVKADLQEHTESFRTHLQANESLDLEPEIEAAMSDAKPALDAYLKSAQDIIETSFTNYEEGVAKFPQFMEAFRFLEDRLGKLSDLIQSESDERAAEGARVGPFCNWLLAGFFMVNLLVGAASIWFLNKSVTSALRSAIDALRQGSREVRSAAVQVSSSSQALAQGATEQAASLEESAAALEEVSSVSKHNTENSNQAFQLAENVRASSSEGVSSMAAMTKAINSIKKSADETAQIVKVIDEIAFQTNLLALNAAVEAARAGDAGKGFAVVAEEIRNLAQRSAKAAKESSEKIHQSKELADNGVKVTNEVAESLSKISQNAIKSADLVKEIAASSKEQSTGISQVNLAVTELDKVTQQNTAAAEETSAASQQLTAQAKTLDEIVHGLSILVLGADSDSAPAQRKITSSETKALKKPVKVTYLTPSKEARVVSSKIWNKSDSGHDLKPTQIIPLDDNDFQGF